MTTKNGSRVAFRNAASLAAFALLLGGQGLAGQTAEEQALSERFESMNKLFEDGDADAMAEFYAEGFVRLPPEAPAVTTHEALREEFTASQAEYDYTVDEFRIRRVVVSGDVGHTVATYTDSQTPKAGGETVNQSGRWAILWKRVDGVWKVDFEIWNLAPPN